MGKLKFTLSNIFLWVGILVSCVLLENTSFLTPVQNTPLADSYFYMLFGIGLFAYIALFIFEHIRNKTKVDIVLLIGLTIFFVCGSLAIWLFKDTTINDTEVVVDIQTKIRYNICFMMFIVTLYSIFFIFVKNKVTLRSFKLVYIGMIIFAFAAIVYSLFTEIDKYEEIFTGDSLRVCVGSFFWNGNMFAGTLYFATIAAIILNVMKKNPLWFIAIAILAFETFLTVSSLSVVSEFLVIFVYLLLEIVVAFKKHAIRSGLLLSVHLSATVAFVMFLFLGRYMDNTVGHIFHRLYHEIFETSQESRIKIWSDSIHYLTDDPIRLIFGNGFGVSTDVCRALNNLKSVHNGFIQILFNYGIVGSVIYLGFLVFFIFGFFRLIKKKTRYVLILTMIGGSLLGYAIGESIIFFNSTAEGMLVGALFYLPLVMETKHDIHKEIKEEVAMSEKPQLVCNNAIIKVTASILLSVFSVLFPVLFIKSLPNYTELFYLLLSIEISVFVLFLFLPYLLSLLTSNKYKIVKGLRLGLNLGGIVILLALGIVLTFVWKDTLKETIIFIVPSILFIVLFIEIMYYSIRFKTPFKTYWVTFETLYKNCIFGVSFTCVTGTLINVLLGDYFEFTLLYVLILIVMNITIFSAGYLLSGLGENRKIIDYYNQVSLFHLGKRIIKNESI